MKYGEIETVLKDNGHNSTIEQLRTAVGEEALELKSGIKGELSEDTAVEQARDLFAEDITKWIADETDPDPMTLIGMRARYAKSWAFAQIIHSLLSAGAEELHVPQVDPDTLVRICLANAELGSKMVEMIGMAQQGIAAGGMANAIETINTALSAAKAPELSESGQRKLAVWERLECVLEELNELRSQGDVQMAADSMCWMAQSIHQGHHMDETGDWKECSKGVCGSMENMLGKIGFDKNLNPIARVP